MKAKTKLLLIFINLVCFNLYGQIDFQENIIIDLSNAAYRASSVFAADLDGDGDEDILSSSSWDDKIAWYENEDGQGTFSTQRSLSVELENASSVSAIDLDGDGDLDVFAVGSDFSNSKIVWFENMDGAGNFSEEQIIDTELGFSTPVFASDLDSDGDVDILSTSSDGDKMGWYENTDGLGAFGAQQIIDSETIGIRSVFASDLDGDGDMDILAASSNAGSNKIMWYENTDGLGTFDELQILSASFNVPVSAYAADLDGDGDMDVLSASSNDDKIVWYKNTTGQGDFVEQQIISTSIEGVRDSYVADLDNDGDLDVLSTSFDDDKIAWYENEDGVGTFGVQQIISIEADEAVSVYAADLDGDGDLDVLSASRGDDKIAWYENMDGLGDFGDNQILTVSASHANDVFSADLDGDGDIDVLSASRLDNKIAWYENEDGLGTFGEQRIITLEAYGAISVHAADIDNDGDMDVFSASFDDDKIAWYENLDGLGNFGPQQVITTNTNTAYSVYTADLDGDGDLDVLSASFFDDKIAWYENTDGLGTFGAQQTITTNAMEATTVYAADMDGDGDMDVLSASSDDDKIAWYENTDGLGSFSSEQIITTNAMGASSLHAADLDGDGDIDVLSSSSNDGKIAWYENEDGLGDFGEQQVIMTNLQFASSVYAVDLDGDGDMDVLSASEGYATIAYYENTDGLGTFGDQEIISTNAQRALSIIASDINGDGDMDVLSASTEDSKIAWYKNLGPLSVKGKENLDFKIFPVPTSNMLDIISETNIVNIEIYNSLAQLVLTNSNTQSIDVSALSNGFYFCKVEDERGAVGIKKIVKEK